MHKMDSAADAAGSIKKMLSTGHAFKNAIGLKPKIEKLRYLGEKWLRSYRWRWRKIARFIELELLNMPARAMKQTKFDERTGATLSNDYDLILLDVLSPS